jgi:trehalose-6-phosphate synthase
MEIKRKKYIMISNRGPNFTSIDQFHRGMGGTKEIYAALMENFCKGWLCLSTKEFESKHIHSDYGKRLKVLFIEKEKYNQYYYQYISEYLYPSLLGYREKAITTYSTNAFNEISKQIVTSVRETFGKSNVIICDYHLYKIPAMINWECRKIFMWFIPILTQEYYFPELKEIIWNLSLCDEIFFFNEVWCRNYKIAFKYYFPNNALMAKIRPLMMGPVEEYSKTKGLLRNDFHSLLKTKLNINNISGKKFLITVSRLDFVKNIPLAISGFEGYLKANKDDKDLNLLLIASHHRRDSLVYQGEEKIINNMVDRSPYKQRIFLTHEYFDASELRLIFKYADIFVCPSTNDAVPLTPLEYVLANAGHGALILSDSIGAYELTFPNCYDFEHENPDALAKVISRVKNDDRKTKEQRLSNIKSIILEETIERAMEKINLLWSVS